MRILALIVARGGSKRLPGKNARLLGGKPLIGWSIDVVKGLPDICDTLVSTDDAVIGRVAEAEGACVPWLRPPLLATDTASTHAVCLHALDWYEEEKGPVDGLMVLQPTSPFRRREMVMQSMDLFKANYPHTVIGVSAAPAHPWWCFKKDGQYLRPFVEDGLLWRSQELPEAFVVNGSMYLIAPNVLRTQDSLLSGTMVPSISESEAESLDIDTEADWQRAETLLASQMMVLPA